MTEKRTRVVTAPRTSGGVAALLVLVLVLVLAWVARSGDAGGDAAPSGAGPSRDLDRCGLLSDEEVEAEIGVHDGGSDAIDIPAMYGSANSCLWTAAGALGAGPHPDGSYDSIEVSVLEGDLADLERQNVADDADAQLVDGFVDGARWTGIAGSQLWFDCTGGRLCHIRISTTDGHTIAGEPVLDASIRLGMLVLERL